MSKAGADWPNALLLTAIHVVGPTITSAYSQNSSWLGLGTTAPPPLYNDSRQLEWVTQLSLNLRYRTSVQQILAQAF